MLADMGWDLSCSRKQKTNGPSSKLARFLSDAETRYAVTELEMLAVLWAVMNAEYFWLAYHILCIH